LLVAGEQRVQHFADHAPAARHNGFILSIVPVALLLVAAAAGVAWALIPHS